MSRKRGFTETAKNMKLDDQSVIISQAEDS